MDQKIINKVFNNEQSLIDLFCEHQIVSVNDRSLIRYYDDLIKDMYDHNFSSFDSEINEDIYQKIIELQKQRNEGHISVHLPVPSLFLKAKGYGEEVLLTMLQTDYDYFDIPSCEAISFSNIKDNPLYMNQIIEIERHYYGKGFGDEFIIRCLNNRYNKIKENNNGFNYFFALKGNEVIGYAYTYYFDDVVSLDGLLVKENYRHQYVASNLIKHIVSFYNCPIYLHADDSETAKEMYKKLGFVTIDTNYAYLSLVRRPVINLSRISLRPLKKEDMEDFLPMMVDPYITSTFMFPILNDRNEKVMLYERLMSISCDPNSFTYGIYLEDKVIGLLNQVDKNVDYIELGYFISPIYWNKGYASEALKGAIEELSRLHHKELRCAFFMGNMASEKVMIKCDMEKTEVKEEITYRGENKIAIYYKKKLN